MTPSFSLHIADTREALKRLPARAAHCAITSPPYMGLRDYGTSPVSWADGWVGELGREEDIDAFIGHLVEVFREVYRVLRDDGTCWIVMGDTFGKRTSRGGVSGGRNAHAARGGRTGNDGDRCFVPARLGLALMADGWACRTDVVWAKATSPRSAGRCLPEPIRGWAWQRHRIKKKKAKRSSKQGYSKASGANDHRHGKRASAQWEECPGCEKCEPDGFVLTRARWRPTAAHETILMLSKGGDYYGDREACAEPLAESSVKRMSQPLFQAQLGGEKTAGNPNSNRSARKVVENLRESGTSTKNLRDVWLVPPGCSKMPHYATFPATIVNPIIMSSTPEGGVCRRCGAPTARILARSKVTGEKFAAGRRFSSDGWEAKAQKTVGWRKTCGCRARLIPATVLDPFVGSGTTLECAAVLGRSAVGVDIDPRSVEMVEKRLGLFTEALEVVK